VRYGGWRSRNNISQSNAFLKEPLIVPLYIGLLQISPFAWYTASHILITASGGFLAAGSYMGRASCLMSRSSVVAPASAAPSNAILSAARLAERCARDPPKPT